MMKTSISNKAFCSITDGQNIYRIDAHLWGESAKKIGAISQLGAEKITFPPKPDIHTYIHTDERTFAFIYHQRKLLVCSSE